MKTDIIKNIFNYIPETNLIEEYFYENKGVYPVFSGQTENNGIVALIDTFSEEKECITFTTYGSAGKLFYRKGKYTIGLQVKNEYKESVNLKWFSYKFQNLFYQHRIGDITGQRSLNKTLIENLKIEIPNIKIQEEQLNSYENAFKYKLNIEKRINNCMDLLKSPLILDKIKYKERIGVVLNIFGGNSGLTEDFIYNNLPSSEDDKIPIFSSSTQYSTTMGYISRNAKLNQSVLKIFRGECILVARNGYAGTMTYIKDKEFTVNDHAYILKLKNEWKDKINLRWFTHQYQELFYNLVTSKSDNATFNKEYSEQQEIDIPDIKFQNEIADKLIKVDKLIEKLGKIKNFIDDLLEYEIT